MVCKTICPKGTEHIETREGYYCVLWSITDVQNYLLIGGSNVVMLKTKSIEP